MRMNPPVKLFPLESKISSSSLNDQNMYSKILKESVEERKIEKEKKKSWISDKSFKILDKKIKALRQNESEKVKEIGKELRRNLRKDRRKRVNDVSIKIEKELKGNNVIEAYDILRGWYKKVSGRSEKPSLEDLTSKS